ncbi:MAG TPA: M1 family aminopeptidase, partial [Aggregatilineales bacterium]|nr:M1 family aminopeptidase [Aggregatilineales bacterium]
TNTVFLQIAEPPFNNEPYQRVNVQVASGDIAVNIPAGQGVLNAEGALVGMVVAAAENRIYISPVSEWIDDLLLANLELQSAELAAVLNAAIVPAVDAAPSIGDLWTPELGNAGIDVLHYDLSLRVEPVEPHIEGTAVLYMNTIYPNLVSFTLDLRDFMTVSAVRVNGTAANLQQSERKIRIFLGQPQPFGATLQVDIDYAGVIESVFSPYFPDSDIGLVESPTRPSFGMISEPDASSSWYPCNDHPADAATYAFHLTIEQPYDAVANGDPVAVRDNPDNTRTFDWEMRFPMATYLATVAIADYELIETQTPDGKIIRNYVYAGADIAKMREIFSGTEPALNLLESLFGKYPYQNYGHVLVPLPGGALETQTMVAMPENFMERDQEGSVWFLVIHEMSHQWFGNNVRIALWQDIW